MVYGFYKPNLQNSTELKCYNTLEVCFVESLPVQGDLCDVNVRSEIHSYDRRDCHVQACAAGREE